MDGFKDVLGLWAADTEGPKFWLTVTTELHSRGIEDIFIACVDGLKGFPEAIEAVFPKTQVQLCIVHLIRNSLKYVTQKDRKHVASDLKAVYNTLRLSGLIAAGVMAVSLLIFGSGSKPRQPHHCHSRDVLR